MHKSHLLLAAAVGVGLSGMASAGTIRHDKSDSLYTNLALQSKYDSVGAILVDEDGNGSADTLGSGVLLSPTWMLTAAHVVDDAWGAGIRFSTSALDNVPFYDAVDVVLYPTWGGVIGADDDLALVQLATPVTNRAPAAIYSQANIKGMVGTHVGYGITGNGSTGANMTGNYTRRAGQNVLDNYGGETTSTNLSLAQFGPNTVLTDFDPPAENDNRMGTATPLDLEYMIAGGDSGGGLFVDDGAGTYLVGIHSFLHFPDGSGNADYGDISGSIRVAAYSSWINSVIPEPTSLGLLAAAGGMLMVRRRR